MQINICPSDLPCWRCAFRTVGKKCRVNLVKKEERMMANIYKYNLELTQVQTIKCKAIKILDIQIQNDHPVMWAITKVDAEEQDVNIIMQGTGMDVLAIVEDLTHISTTQDNRGFVWHWFTDFGLTL